MTTLEQLTAEKEKYAAIVASVDALEAHMRSMYARHIAQKKFRALPCRWRDQILRGSARVEVEMEKMPPITEEARTSARSQIEAHIASLDARIAAV